MENKRETGSNAENLAADYLELKGYMIVKRNFHFGKIAELDIIAEKNNELVFVEVRSGKTTNFGSLQQSMTRPKQHKIRKAAEAYLYINKITDKPCRFDFIAVDNFEDEPVFLHIENAF